MIENNKDSEEYFVFREMQLQSVLQGKEPGRGDLILTERFFECEDIEDERERLLMPPLEVKNSKKRKL